MLDTDQNIQERASARVVPHRPGQGFAHIVTRARDIPNGVPRASLCGFIGRTRMPYGTMPLPRCVVCADLFGVGQFDA